MSRELVRFLSLKNVIAIHADTIAHEGGLDGIRDGGLLASEVEMPQAAIGGEYLHADVPEIAAAYLYHICQNQAFLDGIKRSAAFVAVIFLDMNGYTEEMLPTEDALEEVTLKAAAGQMTKAELTQFFRDN